jgi:two-component system cell cycle sensor histidine kinase/response regulator CckA
MNILLVDDDEAIRRFVSRVLRLRGHTVLAAADGCHALDALARHRFDLLISDIVMPALTGPELAATARALQPDLSILLMSGSGPAEGYPFLPKPFETRNLLVAIEEARGRLRGVPSRS